jgi:dihydroorotate dehydrogenase (fumarate)
MDNFIISNAPCTASCTEEQLQDIEDSKSDWIVSKTCTLSGSSKEPGIYYYDGIGAVNNIGMVGFPFDYYKSMKFKKPYIISIAGTLNDINQMLHEESSVCAYEINISCPNISKGGLRYVDYKDIPKLDCNHIEGKPLGIKLPPLSDEIDVKIYASYIIRNKCVSYVVCCNTGQRGYVFKDGKFAEGALSGKYLKPIALWNVKKFRECLPDYIQVFGCGGISSLKDVNDFKLAGADGIQVATALIEEGPDIFSKLKNKGPDVFSKL